MSTLDDWIIDACRALGLPAESITHDLRNDLLDLTRDVAHGIARPAGPLSTYLVGLAVAGGTPSAAAIRRLSELAAVHGEQAGDGAVSADPATGSSGQPTEQAGQAGRHGGAA